MILELDTDKEVDWTCNINAGKYIYVFYKDGSSECLRYGKKWRNTIGDNLIYWMAVTIKNSTY